MPKYLRNCVGLFLISLLFLTSAYGAGMVCNKPTMGGFSPISFSFTCTNTSKAIFYGYNVLPYNPPTGSNFSINTGVCADPSHQIGPGQSCTVTGTFSESVAGTYSLDFSDYYGGEWHNGIFKYNSGSPVSAQVTSWHTYYQAGPGANPRSVFVDSQQVVYVATGNGGLAVSRDRGVTWTNYTTSNGLPSNNVTTVYVDGNTIYAGSSSKLSVSTNGGASWLSFSQTFNLLSAIYASGQNIYVIARQGQPKLFISRDGGSTWNVNNTVPASQGVYGVGSAVYVATLNSGVYISSNAGSTWTQSTSGLGSNNVHGVYASANGQTIYAATAGGLSISTDAGSNWLNYTTGLASTNILAVYAIGSTIYAATDAGLSVGSIINNNWTGNNYLVSDNIPSVAAHGTYIYAIVAGSGLAISTNNGSSWTIVTTTAQGLGGNQVNAVYAIGSTIYTALNNDGGLSVSYDSGQHWTTYTTANGLSNNTILSVYAVGNTIYAGTNGHGLSFNTNNGSGNWTTVLNNLSIQGVFASGSNVFVGTYDGGNGEVEVSTDGGQTWTQSYFISNSYFTGVYFNGSNIYAPTTGSGVGLSIGTGSGSSFNWNNITNGLPNGLSQEVYASANGLDIYVPTNLGLYISHDGGNNWQQHTAGLASTNVFGVYVSSGKIYAATAGGLSISADDGLTWTNYTTANGLSSNQVNWVYVDGFTIYAATNNGLSVAQ
jgi:hypothetical protein